jgi:hypothetical protein
MSFKWYLETVYPDHRIPEALRDKPTTTTTVEVTTNGEVTNVEDDAKVQDDVTGQSIIVSGDDQKNLTSEELEKLTERRMKIKELIKDRKLTDNNKNETALNQKVEETPSEDTESTSKADENPETPEDKKSEPKNEDREKEKEDPEPENEVEGLYDDKNEENKQEMPKNETKSDGTNLPPKYLMKRRRTRKMKQQRR